MNSRFDFVAYILRARHAILGAGSIQMRRQGNNRILITKIPGTNIRAMMREHDGRVYGAFMQQKSSAIGLPLDRDDELHRFMMMWDTMLMQKGFGAAFFPVAALEFVDALVFDENRMDLLFIRPAAARPLGFSLDAGAEWKPTDGLCELLAEYLDNPMAQVSTREAAASLLRFMEDTEDRVFEPVAWSNRWFVQLLKNACASGRMIESGSGVWREMLSMGSLGTALRFLSRYSPNPATASAAMSSHMGTFMSHYPTGGCDLYLLWDHREVPCAIAAIGADGKHVSLTAPSSTLSRPEDADVAALMHVAGSIAEGPKNRKSANF